jgi:hypothetical protein
MRTFLAFAGANISVELANKLLEGLFPLMKKIAFIFMLTLGCAWNCHAQTWTYIQDSLATFCSSGSSCNLTTGNILPTTAGTVWIVLVQDISSNGFKISSVSGGGGTWTVCSTCTITGQGRTLSVAYNLSGAGGTSSITVNLTGNSPNLGVNFMEVLPPPGSTASFDTAGTNVSPGCSGTCPGVGLTITGTDVIIQNMHANNASTWNAWSAPYTTLPLGEGLLLNATSGAAPTVVVDSTGVVENAIAFKSTAGSFTPPSQPISVVNYSYSVPGINCTSPCSISIPSTGAGHLMYIEMANMGGSSLSSVTDNGGKTWTVPSGCKIGMSLSGSDELSCAYLLSSASGTTQVNVTMTGGANNTYYAIWEIASTGGPFTLDQIASVTNGASPNPSGVSFCSSGCAAPALTGTNDIIFQSIFVPGGSSSVGFYPYPRISGQATQFFNNNAANAALLNTTNGAAPLWIDQQNQATIVSGLAFKTGTGTAVAPPTGLAAVVN